MPQSTSGMDRTAVMSILNSQIRVLRHCERPCSIQWDAGFVMSPSVAELIHVSYDTNLLVQDAALNILSLATHGRMSPQRFWRLLMTIGFSSLECDCYRPNGIDYREGINVITQLPQPFHDMDLEDVLKLEELGDVELIQRTLVHRGMFWVWMNPDWYVETLLGTQCTTSSNKVITVSPPPGRRAQQLTTMCQLQLKHNRILRCYLTFYLSLQRTAYLHTHLRSRLHLKLLQLMIFPSRCLHISFPFCLCRLSSPWHQHRICSVQKF